MKHNGCVEKKIKSGVDDGFFHSYGVSNVVIVCTGEGVKEQNKSLKGHRCCFVFIIKKFSFTVYKELYFSALCNKS